MITWPIHITMTNWLIKVLKGDSMVWHHIGPNRMYPDRSSCLGLSANGWMSQDQVFCTFSEQMLRSVYSTIHGLGLVPASTIPRGGSGWYKPMGIYCGILNFEHLLRECTECLVCQLIEPFADKPRQELLSGCIWLGPMWCPPILSTFRTSIVY